ALLRARLWPGQMREPLRQVLARSLGPDLAGFLPPESSGDLDPAVLAQLRTASRHLPSLAALLAELRTVDLTLEVDRKAHRASLALAVVPREGSGPAGLAGSLGRARGRFAPVGRGAAQALVIALPPFQGPSKGKLLAGVPPQLRAVIPPRYQELA